MSTTSLPPVEHESVCGSETLAELDGRIQRIVRDVLATPAWRTIADPNTPLEVVKAIIRELYWEVHCYQPNTTRAGFAMLGRISPAEHKAMRTLLLHKWEEVEHSVWALDGYKALGGDKTRIGREAEFVSSGAFAVAAVWDRLAKDLHPLSYLGAEYLFEDLTAQLTSLLMPIIRARELPVAGARFIVDHATEDEKHSELLKRLIKDVAGRHPELRSQFLFAFDCFAHVYPLHLWNGSFQRAWDATGYYP